MQVKSGIRRVSYCLALLLTLAFLAMTGCGGGGEAEAAGELSTEDRLAIMDAQMTAFQEYIVVQAQKEAQQQSRQVVVEVGEDGEEVVSTTAFISAPLYSLRRQDASENEEEIVLWMADCAARTYLNPDLPTEVIDHEIARSADRMWEALETGQYSSFENYIGMAFRFCQARIVEEGAQE